MKKVGFAITGSFCTFKNTLETIENLIFHDYDLFPILSFNASTFDTRFFKASDFIEEVENLCKKKIINTIIDAEPIGNKLSLDMVVVSPCTGNTLAKMAHGITDTPVTMAIKAELRNNRPIVISISSNDALGANAKNIGQLLNTKNVYFVPFNQDAPTNKTNSIIANTKLTYETCEEAFKGKQLEPLFYERKNT